MPSLRLFAVALTLSLAVGGLGCATETDGSDGAGASSQDLTQSVDADQERTVRAYYNATKTADPTVGLNAIVDDDAAIAAPSIRILKGVDEIKGKENFVKVVAGGSFLIGLSRIREVISHGDLVIARSDLPLPNGDTITQVEYFQMKNGKIARMDSYYDALRFTAALPAIALDRLKHAFGG